MPAGGTVEFSTNWVPPSTGHFCIVVRIPLYVVPTAPTSDASITTTSSLSCVIRPSTGGSWIASPGPITAVFGLRKIIGSAGGFSPPISRTWSR